MGNEASTEDSVTLTKVLQYGEEDYDLQDVKKISINDKVDIFHVWIDGEINNEENIKHYNNLKEDIRIQRFSSVREFKNKVLCNFGINQKVKVICAASLEDYEFKQLQNQNRVISIFLFCRNEQRAQLLKDNFPKIADAFFSCSDFYSSFHNKKYQTVIQVQKLSILYYPSNTNMINKFRLNYNCMCLADFESRGSSGPKLQSKEDFLKLCEHLFPNKKAQLNNFISELKFDENINAIILKWAFDSKSFFWEVINKLPKVTLDLKRLGYLRMPFYYLYKAILEQYNQQKKKKSPPSKLYLVSEVNENQQQILINNQPPFLIFTTFVKGFTSQSAALKSKAKKDNNYIFEIDISRAATDPKLDFGYVIDQKSQQQNVIFNLYNFFSIDQISPQKKHGYIRYGGLAHLNLQRLHPTSQSKLTHLEQDILRNYDYLQNITSKIHSQANILQISGYFEDAIVLYKKKIDKLIEKKVDTKILDIFYLELAEAYKMNQQYRAGEKIINRITTNETRMLGKIVLAQIFLKKEHLEKMNEQIQELKPFIKQIKEINLVQYFRLQNLIGVSNMRLKKYEETKKHFQDLLNQLRIYYKFRYQGIPIVHDVMRNIAICQHKLNNNQASIKMLQNVKKLQNACEGTGPSLALTQAILNSIHLSQGNSPKLQKSRNFLQAMGDKVTFNEIDYINANVVVADMKSSIGLLKQAINQKSSPTKKNLNLNESSVNVDFLDNITKKNSNLNLNESSVNIDFDKSKKPPVNLDQSIIGIDL